jgi:hypothetical protein
LYSFRHRSNRIRREHLKALTKLYRKILSCKSSAVTEVASPDRAGWDRFDFVLAACAAIAAVLVHPVSTLLRHPYWVDEAWVADLTRAHWSPMVAVGSPTPVGFLALLKLVPGTGQHRGRLLVLAFTVLGVIAAYVLARVLAWESRRTAQLAATATAFVVMMAPLALVRNDLKQYTCDAFCALAILAIGVATDRDDGLPLAWLGAACVAAVLVSSTSAFVTAAMFGGLVLSTVVRGRRDRIREVIVAAVVTGVLLAAYLALVVNPKLSNGLHDYWRWNYLRGSPALVLRSTGRRLDELAPMLAMPAIVFVVLFLVGIYQLTRLRERAIAIALPLLWVEMMVVGRLRKYPFLELRTSQFLLVASLAVVAIGAVAIVRVLSARVHRAAAIAVAVMFALLFTAGSAEYVRDIAIARENVKAQTEYVAEHRRPGDVILVSDLGNFGFAYYWPHGRVVLRRDDSGAGFRARVAGVDAVYARDRTYRAIRDALADAVRRWRGPAGGGRLFIVRTHLNAAEIAGWHRAFAEMRVAPERALGGREPLLVLSRD